MAALIPSASATGSGTMTLAGPSTNSNQTITIPDATGTMMVSGNMPAFSATAGTSQSISSSTWTKIQFATEQFDTNNNFDSTTNYRFTPTVAGYYLITLAAGHGSASNNVLGSIYKNGSSYQQGQGNATSATYDPCVNISCVIYFNGSSDYVEGYLITNTTTTTENCRFTGCLMRAA
jgi:hypothetical protein